MPEKSRLVLQVSRNQKTVLSHLKPLVLRRFRWRCGWCKISAVVVYKKSRCRLISVLFASIFVIQTYNRSHWKIPSEQLASSTCTLEKRLYHLPMEISENLPGLFGGIVSAHGLGRAYRKAVFLGQQIGKVSIYAVFTKTESWLGVVLA